MTDLQFPTPVEAIAYLINALDELRLIADDAVAALKHEDIRNDIAMARENIQAAIEVAQLAEARLAAAMARQAVIDAEARLDHLLVMAGYDVASAAG
jgi:ribosomal protein L18